MRQYFHRLHSSCFTFRTLAGIKVEHGLYGVHSKNGKIEYAGGLIKIIEK